MMFVTLIACSSQTITSDIVLLDLKLTIGPVCPVEPCNKTAVELTVIDESYKT
jgi:hypothetical protein